MYFILYNKCSHLLCHPSYHFNTGKKKGKEGEEEEAEEGI